MQNEIGYSNATEYRSDLLEITPAIAEFRNVCGIITAHVANGKYETVYTCEDAQAWGTVSTFETEAEALEHITYTQAGLEA
jgi:hypothetical protein